MMTIPLKLLAITVHHGHIMNTLHATCSSSLIPDDNNQKTTISITSNTILSSNASGELSKQEQQHIHIYPRQTNNNINNNAIILR